MKLIYRPAIILTVALFGVLVPISVVSAQEQVAAPQDQAPQDVFAQLDELRRSNAELGARMLQLNANNAELDGRIETLQFLLGQSRQQVNQMQVDDAEIDRLIRRLNSTVSSQGQRIEELEQSLAALTLRIDEETVLNTDVMVAPAPTGTVALVAPVEETPVASDNTAMMTGTGQTIASQATEPAAPAALPEGATSLFAEGKSRLLRFDYVGAEAAFEAFIERFPDDPQAGEAQYWLGEALYQQDAFGLAGQAYTGMIRAYPDNPRAPEALVKLARAMRLSGDTERACGALDILPQRYPDASGVTNLLASGERVKSGCDE